MQFELILPLVLWESGGWVEFPGRKERARGLSNHIVLSSQVHKDTWKVKRNLVLLSALVGEL